MSVGAAQTTHCTSSSHIQSRRAGNEIVGCKFSICRLSSRPERTYLLAVLFSPSKDAPGTLTHDFLNILPVNPPRLCPILVAVFEVDAMFLEKVSALLFIVYGTMPVSTFRPFSSQDRRPTYTTCRGPSASQFWEIYFMRQHPLH